MWKDQGWLGGRTERAEYALGSLTGVSMRRNGKRVIDTLGKLCTGWFELLTGSGLQGQSSLLWYMGRFRVVAMLMCCVRVCDLI